MSQFLAINSNHLQYNFWRRAPRASALHEC